MEQMHELISVKEPGFPTIKIGKRYYVMADKVNEWMESRLNREENGQ